MENAYRWMHYATALGIACVGAVRADDVQVNTYTTGRQTSSSVGLNDNGNVVIVWTSEGSSGTDTSERSIQGQRYAPDGSPAGGEFQVNTYTTGFQLAPSVAVGADGGFVVVWTSGGSSGTDSRSSSIQGQRFSSNGSTVGGEFQVNTITYQSQGSPSVALAPDGDFIVVWDSLAEYGSFCDIQVQRFASDGSPIGDELQVNTYNEGEQRNPSLAIAANGDFVVAWAGQGSAGTDTSYYSVQGQRFASDGSFAGGEFQVNTYTSGRQTQPSVGSAGNGEFVVVWFGPGLTLSSYGYNIYGQRFTAGGSIVGDEFQIDTDTTDSATPSIAMNADGEFVVAWTSYGSSGTDASSTSIQGQRYASDGSIVGETFQINTYTTDSQRSPEIALNEGGEFVVAWNSIGSGGKDVSYSSIQKTPATRIFADGFESGDLTAWSDSVP